jgi:hypothetical protein
LIDGIAINDTTTSGIDSQHDASDVIVFSGLPQTSNNL